jgi:hypothetical protein
MIEAFRDSAQCGDVFSVVRQLVGEATLSRSGHTAYERRCGLAGHACTGSDASAAKAFSQRGVRRRDRRATWRCDTDFRSVGHVEDELEASGGGSAIPAQGAEKLDRQRTPGDTRRSRARTDAEVSLSMFSLFCDANT